MARPRLWLNAFFDAVMLPMAARDFRGSTANSFLSAREDTDEHALDNAEFVPMKREQTAEFPDL